METAEMEFHVPTAFKAGDRVKITRKVDEAVAWYSDWSDGMNGMVGLENQKVVQVDPLYGYFIGNKSCPTGVAWFPSASLELMPDTPVAIAVQDAKDLIAKAREPKASEPGAGIAPGMFARKPRAVKAGPWDAAPCTHLRWHMMGFYNEKLKLSVSRVKTDDGRDLAVNGVQAELTFGCTKCGTSIVMTAPVNTMSIKGESK